MKERHSARSLAVELVPAGGPGPPCPVPALSEEQLGMGGQTRAAGAARMGGSCGKKTMKVLLDFSSVP